MIYYITQKENAGLLDGIAESMRLTVSKVTDQRSLAKLMDYGNSNLSHISYFVMDMAALQDDEAEALQAAFSVISMYSARVIVITSKNTTSDFIGGLMDKGVYNVVTARDPVGINEQLKRCFTNEGMSREELEKAYYGYESRKEPVPADPVTVREKPPKPPRTPDAPISAPTPTQSANAPLPQINRPQILMRRKTAKLKQHITIAVVGVCRRMGTTHQALLIAKFLQSIGYKVCYLEANSHKSIGLLQGVYDIERDGAGRIVFDGVDMYYGYIFPEVAARGYDFFVFDFGSFEEAHTETVLTKDIKIIVGGGKAWELSGYEKLYEGVSGYKDLNFILNFVPENERGNMTALLRRYKGRVFFSDYAPYLFEKGANTHIYGKLFADFAESYNGYENVQREPKSGGVMGFIKGLKK